MFDDASSSGDAHDALAADHPGDPVPDFLVPHADAGALLATVGLPNRAIREVLGNPPDIGADR